VLSRQSQGPSTLVTRQAATHHTLSSSKSSSSEPKRNQNNGNSKKKRKPKTPTDSKVLTIADLQNELLQNPARYLADGTSTVTPRQKKRSSYKRTRQRVERPKQTYLYKSQRQRQSSSDSEDDESEDSSTNQLASSDGVDRRVLDYAKEVGLQVSAQHCDPIVARFTDGQNDAQLAVDVEQPRIIGKLCLEESDVVDKDDDPSTSSASFAYIIEKPPGWAILGSGGKGSKRQSSPPADRTKAEELENIDTNPTPPKSKIQKVKVVDEGGSADILEYNEMDLLAVMTPEEIEEYLAEIKSEDEDSASDAAPKVQGKFIPQSLKTKPEAQDTASTVEENALEEDNPDRLANLQRIALRQASNTSPIATFTPDTRPSVVAWLKDFKDRVEDTKIRGGKFWVAVAGATEVDDSGLVLLCPRSKVDQVFVDLASYVAVVGTGGSLAPKTKVQTNKQTSPLSEERIEIDIVGKLRKGRDSDVVHTVSVVSPEGPSTCSSIIDACQNQFQQGIRGDAAANPFDRRARRRLIHCRSLSVSSLAQDDHIDVELPNLPDDIAVLADRRNSLTYSSGSFLGRSDLRRNLLTNAYREINGEADGFPGWTVDRYDKWLFVQHDPKQPRGPLPSIHDGNTLGVYVLEATQDRGTMGAVSGTRPQLLEGQKAPETFPIIENGVSYLVSLEKDLSTGIFLDQRPQRAWLSRNCGPDTRVLNCFAHTGCFSVAAAVAGASTVSVDLSKKWLDRLPQQLEANGIPFNEKHDCIYGDCFDWLARLSKRGEKFDIVILDPPSSSVGGRKKKRWSVKNNMDELVALASGLVKSGGLLWTTTNSASIHPFKFARLCKKGLDAGGMNSAKLERIQPMPMDFPSIGTQPVNNLVWRIP